MSQRGFNAQFVERDDSDSFVAVRFSELEPEDLFGSFRSGLIDTMELAHAYHEFMMQRVGTQLNRDSGEDWLDQLYRQHFGTYN